MPKRTMTEKILMLIAASVKEGSAMITYPHWGLGKLFKNYHGNLSHTIYELKKCGYLEQIEIEGQKYLKLTPKGRLKTIKRKILKKWDGYWRIVAFDIEESKKKTRDLFRSKLRELNCQPIQKSVWITPNDISNDLEEIIDILNLKENVDYFLSKALTNEEKYLEMFKIKKIDK